MKRTVGKLEAAQLGVLFLSEHLPSPAEDRMLT